MTDPAPRTRRLGLFLPVILLGLLAAGWSGFWVFARNEAENRLTGALSREAANGRRWTCQDRAFGGFPFRLELRCGDLELVRTTDAGGPIRLNLGGFAAVTQVYAPGHVIAESPGPLTITAPGGAVTRLDWTTGQISLRLDLSGLDRASLQLDRPRLTLTGTAADGEGTARLLELHLRRHPTRPAEERAQEIAWSLTEAAGPWLEAVIRNGQPAEMSATLTLPQAPLFLGGIRPATLKSWAATGSTLMIDRFRIRKGPAELQLSGTLGVDELNRPKGRIAASQSGITEIGGVRVGGLLGLGGLLAPPPSAQAGGLKPLPVVDLREGRVYLGPVRVPELRLDPLF